jgi:hypothetical protein
MVSLHHNTSTRSPLPREVDVLLFLTCLSGILQMGTLETAESLWGSGVCIFYGNEFFIGGETVFTRSPIHKVLPFQANSNLFGLANQKNSVYLKPRQRGSHFLEERGDKQTCLGLS